MSVASKKDRRRWRAWFFYQGVCRFGLVGNTWPHPSCRLQSSKKMHALINDNGRDPHQVARLRAMHPLAMDHRNTYKGVPF